MLKQNKMVKLIKDQLALSSTSSKIYEKLMYLQLKEFFQFLRQNSVIFVRGRVLCIIQLLYQKN